MSSESSKLKNGSPASAPGKPFEEDDASTKNMRFEKSMASASNADPSSTSLDGKRVDGIVKDTHGSSPLDRNRTTTEVGSGTTDEEGMHKVQRKLVTRSSHIGGQIENKSNGFVTSNAHFSPDLDVDDTHSGKMSGLKHQSRLKAKMQQIRHKKVNEYLRCARECLQSEEIDGDEEHPREENDMIHFSSDGKDTVLPTFTDDIGAQKERNGESNLKPPNRDKTFTINRGEEKSKQKAIHSAEEKNYVNRRKAKTRQWILQGQKYTSSSMKRNAENEKGFQGFSMRVRKEIEREMAKAAREKSAIEESARKKAKRSRGFFRVISSKKRYLKSLFYT
jgi:hypothetical protein